VPTIPHLIPVADPAQTVPLSPLVDSSMFGTYDVAIGGLGFRLASDANRPMSWDLVPLGSNRFAVADGQQPDDASEPGENSLSGWWQRSQSSFHGGAGNLNIERVDMPPEFTHIRYDQSKNVDPWTAGKVSRLPDTIRITTDTSSSLAAINLSGVDRAVSVNQSGQLKLINPDLLSTTQFTAVTDTVTMVCSDGQHAYAVSPTAGSVWKVDPASTGTATKIASFTPSTAAAIGWVKARLMVAAGNLVYEVDSTASSTVALGITQLRYTHPTPGWKWRCFAESSTSILVAGDAGSHSEVAEFALVTEAGTPSIAVADIALTLPPGERILTMLNTMSTFLAIGTTKGIRIAEYGSSYSSADVTCGPLILPATETQFQVAALAARDRFIYAAGLAIDEPGLIRIDLSVKTDQAGRYAYSTDLIAPVTGLAATEATALCSLPSGRLVFSIPGYGIVKEGTGPGTIRTAWLRTSRIRFNTTDPKLFKKGRIKADGLLTSSIQVVGSLSTGTTSSATVGFISGDPDEFTLPSGAGEWLTLTFNLNGAAAVLSSWGVKAMPGIKRQRSITITVAAADRETDRSGHRSVDRGSARTRVEALYDLAELGDETVYQEFSLYGERRMSVVIKRVVFVETGRPTPTSDFSGDVTITMVTIV
jgi:hypothetical protein